MHLGVCGRRRRHFNVVILGPRAENPVATWDKPAAVDFLHENQPFDAAIWILGTGPENDEAVGVAALSGAPRDIPSARRADDEAERRN
ncbi:hypothetical protein J6595_09740 [Jiella sp. KSK16Y-1]|uniref:Uncharacterized protein n=1 Tax=Jiella mangrovi TaxID=2821407 RepID=A0ABS4BI58_9HYPH|nr:hypothetical protein [Jiella mangrovi]